LDLCVLITVILLIGGLPILSGPMQSTAEVHTLLEAVATVLAIVCGTMASGALLRPRRQHFFDLGSGFLGTASVTATTA